MGRFSDQNRLGRLVSPEKLEASRRLRQASTRAERILWQSLRGNRLDGWHFKRQEVISGFIVDFYCHRAALVVELDGSVHLHQREYDAERDQLLEARGLRILRFTNDAVEQGSASVLQQIAAACRQSIPTQLFTPSPDSHPRSTPPARAPSSPSPLDASQSPLPPSAQEAAPLPGLPSPSRGGAGGEVAGDPS